jgi:Sap, sulfolipid-1-addressing protein
MLEALGHILPISVAVALSTVPIMATIVILLSPNRNRSSVPFMIGWVLGLAIVVTIFTVLSRGLPASSPKGPQLGIAIGEIILGLALVVFAIVTWRRAIDKPKSTDTPKWLSAVGSLGPWSCFGLAFILNLRPKALLLAAAAGLSLRGDDLTPTSTAIVIAIYTVISATTVAGPIIATLIAPNRTQKWLLNAREFLTKNSRLVTILIMLMVGVVIVGDGLTRL